MAGFGMAKAVKNYQVRDRELRQSIDQVHDELVSQIGDESRTRLSSDAAILKQIEQLQAELAAERAARLEEQLRVDVQLTEIAGEIEIERLDREAGDLHLRHYYESTFTAVLRRFFSAAHRLATTPVW